MCLVFQLELCNELLQRVIASSDFTTDSSIQVNQVLSLCIFLVLYIVGKPVGEGGAVIEDELIRAPVPSRALINRLLENRFCLPEVEDLLLHGRKIRLRIDLGIEDCRLLGGAIHVESSSRSVFRRLPVTGLGVSDWLRWIGGAFRGTGRRSYPKRDFPDSRVVLGFAGPTA